MTRLHAEALATAILRALAFPDPDGVGAVYPYEVSDGHLAKGTEIVCRQRETGLTGPQVESHPTAALGAQADRS